MSDDTTSPLGVEDQALNIIIQGMADADAAYHAEIDATRGKLEALAETVAQRLNTYPRSENWLAAESRVRGQLDVLAALRGRGPA